MKEPIAVDFETEAIETRPHYPPKPVGVAIKYPGKAAKYLAWGHSLGNNCSEQAAKSELSRVFKERVVFHNSKFDVDVAETHLGISPPNYDKLEDTMLLGFLDDPHSRQLNLKAMSVRYLGREPTERNELRDWMIANVPGASKAKTQWGAHIAKAPAGLVGNYAAADVEMTAGIWKILHGKLLSADNMLKAYVRELKLIPILLENEREGVRVDLKSLETDVPVFENTLEKLDVWLRKRLKASPDLNLDSNDQFADALEDAGLISSWVLTVPDKNGKGGGKRSVSKGALDEMVSDRLLLAALEYRSALATFTRTFLSPWRDIARQTGGWVHTTWNSTAQEEGGGTRTGRLSSAKPTNFMNIPSGEKYESLSAKLESAGLFKLLKWLPKLPQCRYYILADDDKSVIIGRDFAQQEPRVLAHFEDGSLCSAYRDNPNMDVYLFAVGEMLARIGKTVTRKDMKVIILAILYGLGNGKLAEKLNCSVQEAKNFKDAFLAVFPDIKELVKELKNLAKGGLPMRTWGGREYYCEPPRVISGVLRSFEYKMINYLVQGSSADITKESVIRFHEAKRNSRFMLTVHDENAASSPKKCWKSEMKILKECMNGIELDAPLTSDGVVGPRWFNMEEVA